MANDNRVNLCKWLESKGYKPIKNELVERKLPASNTESGSSNPQNPEECYINDTKKTIVCIAQNFQVRSKDKVAISIGRNEESTLYPFKNVYKNYNEKYKFFILVPCAEPTKPENKPKYKIVENFIVSLEPISIREHDLSKLKSATSMDFGRYNDLEEKLTTTDIKTKKLSYLSYRRIKVENNDFFATFILAFKNEENSEKKYKYLNDYMKLFDSRTYKDVVDVTKWIATEMHKNNAKNLGLPRNLLIYGAPGTGKSHYIDDKFEKDFYCVPEETEKLEQYRKELSEKLGIDIPEDADIKATIKNEFFTRVTFYEDYSYEHFVGCYKPIKKDDKITYEFEAGPFIDIYIKAKENPDNPYLLAVEEINRADAAAVFGDLFQVLDRDNDGSSEYSVKPEAALNKYLEEHLYIWATMNSADQGVHVLDSAFKRRWQFLYMDIGNSPSSAKADGREIVLPFGNSKIKTYAWGSFRNAVNEVLEKNNIEEDRWVGAWFFKDEELNLINKFYEEKDNTKLKPNPLVDKLLAYLLQDVVKMNKDILFQGKYHNMSSIRKALSNSEVNIFDVLTQKINIDKKEDEDIADKREIVLPVGDNKTETYTWGSFRKAVNEVLEKNNIEKDRQIEAWFFKGRELKSIETFYKEKDTDNKDNPLVDKLLEQLSKINKDIFKQGYSDISSVHGDLSNSVSPKSIFEVLNIDKNALEKVQETENPTPTNAESAPNGQQTQAVTENG